MSPPVLVLFDIDGTLLLSEGAGAKAMQEAGKKVVGPHFDLSSVPFAGRLDPLIWADGARLAGVEDPERVHEPFRRLYAESLARRLSTSARAHTLPGVDDLLAAIETREELTLGLVTGNYPETGAIKLDAAGLSLDRFPVRAWGTDGGDRRALPRVAMDRYREATGRSVLPTRVVVVGDTAADVDCAHANGCRAIAVATGPVYSLEDLRDHQPELLLPDLADTGRVLAFLEDVRSA